MELRDRLAAWREHLNITYPELSRLTGIPERTLKGYEAGDRNPGSDALASLAKSGINLHWLLTGEGPMRSGGEWATQPVLNLDMSRLKAAIAAVDEGLDAVQRKLPPDMKAEMIQAAYELMAEPESARAKVVQIIRAVA